MSLYHPVPFIFDGVDEATKFFERAGNNDLVVCLAVSNAFELETHQAGGQTSLRPG